MSILTKKIEEDGGFYAVFSDKVQLPVGARFLRNSKWDATIPSLYVTAIAISPWRKYDFKARFVGFYWFGCCSSVGRASAS